MIKSLNLEKLTKTIVQKNTIGIFDIILVEKTLKSINIFANDEIEMGIQKKNFIRKEGLLIEEEMRKTISEIVLAIEKSDNKQYLQLERSLDEILRIVAIKGDQMLIEFLEYKLSEAKMQEKILQLKKIFKKKEEKPKFWKNLYEKSNA